jgi:RNA polymerase sigma factor (sigma-70 family)
MAHESKLTQVASFRDNLLYRAQQGDEHALSGLYAKLGPLLKKMAKVRCRALGLDQGYIDDIVQTVFLHILDPRRARYNPDRGNSGSYLTGLVWNAAREQFGPAWLNTVSDPDLEPLVDRDMLEANLGAAGGSDPAWVCEVLDFTAKASKQAREALQHRASEDARIVYLRAVEDMSFKEIAEVTGMSRFRVSRHYSATLDDLHRSLQALA